jgi:hypothetical protein
MTASAALNTVLDSNTPKKMWTQDDGDKNMREHPQLH